MLRYRPGCECKMFPIGFLLFASVFISCGFLRKSMDSRDCWDRFFIENLFLLGTINEHLKLTRDEIISWRQIIMSQGVAVNQKVMKSACYLPRHCQDNRSQLFFCLRCVKNPSYCPLSEVVIHLQKIGRSLIFTYMYICILFKVIHPWLTEDLLWPKQDDRPLAPTP